MDKSTPLPKKAEVIQTKDITAETIKVDKIEPAEGLVKPLPPHIPPTTTNEENMNTAGQRRINLIWEFTQAAIAISITWAVIYTALKDLKSDVLTNAFFLIVSMYFVRTNHTLVGGTGKKPHEVSAGR